MTIVLMEMFINPVRKKRLRFIQIFVLIPVLFIQHSLCAQNDTIWKGDTMIVIEQTATPLPLYGGDYILGKYGDAVGKIESDGPDANSMNMYVLSIMKAKDAERMKVVMPTLTENAGFMWLYSDPTIRSLVGAGQFANDSAKARSYFEKSFGKCDFEYFAVISKCRMQTGLFRDMIWFYGEQEEVWKLMWTQQNTLDSLNVVTIDSIIGIKKLPTKDKVSVDGMSSFFLCVQHFDKEDFLRYRKYMLQLNRRKEISSSDYAYYIDRFLVYKNRKQRYATQVRIGTSGSVEFYPLKSPKKVNAKRGKAGLNGSKEDYLKSFN